MDPEFVSLPGPRKVHRKNPKGGTKGRCAQLEISGRPTGFVRTGATAEATRRGIREIPGDAQVADDSLENTQQRRIGLGGFALNRKPYNLKVKVRNNFLLQRMREKGIESVAELCRQTGLNNVQVGKYLNLKAGPYKKMAGTGAATETPTKAVSRLCAFFGCDVEDIFPAEHINSPLVKNVGEVSLESEEVASIVSQNGPDAALMREDLDNELNRLVRSLTSREQDVLTRRFGLDGGNPETLADIARKYDRSVTRIREIEQKALRKLRNPRRLEILGECF